jgi:hypothetical protein
VFKIIFIINILFAMGLQAMREHLVNQIAPRNLELQESFRQLLELTNNNRRERNLELQESFIQRRRIELKLYELHNLILIISRREDDREIELSNELRRNLLRLALEIGYFLNITREGHSVLNNRVGGGPNFIDEFLRLIVSYRSILLDYEQGRINLPIRLLNALLNLQSNTNALTNYINSLTDFFEYINILQRIPNTPIEYPFEFQPRNRVPLRDLAPPPLPRNPSTSTGGGGTGEAPDDITSAPDDVPPGTGES